MQQQQADASTGYRMSLEFVTALLLSSRRFGMCHPYHQRLTDLEKLLHIKNISARSSYCISRTL